MLRDVLEVRSETVVELRSVDMGDALGEIAGEDPETRPDLEHDIAGLELGEPADHAQDVLVDEKVLPEALAGYVTRDAHRPNTAFAFAST